jgi:hypothetical protein
MKQHKNTARARRSRGWGIKITEAAGARHAAIVKEKWEL